MITFDESVQINSSVTAEDIKNAVLDTLGPSVVADVVVDVDSSGRVVVVVSVVGGEAAANDAVVAITQGSAPDTCAGVLCRVDSVGVAKESGLAARPALAAPLLVLLALFLVARN